MYGPKTSCSTFTAESHRNSDVETSCTPATESNTHPRHPADESRARNHHDTAATTSFACPARASSSHQFLAGGLPTASLKGENPCISITHSLLQTPTTFYYATVTPRPHNLELGRPVSTAPSISAPRGRDSDLQLLRLSYHSHTYGNSYSHLHSVVAPSPHPS